LSKLYVGIDVSLRKNNVHCMAAAGDTLKKFKVPNTFDGALAMVDNIVEISARHSLQEVILGLEATSNYGYHLASLIRNSEKLAPLSPKIHVLNAMVVRNFKKSYIDLPKNDDVDAWVIADKLRFGRLPQEVFMDERFLALQRLTRTRFHLVNTIKREKTLLFKQSLLEIQLFTPGKGFLKQFRRYRHGGCGGIFIPR